MNFESICFRLHDPEWAVFPTSGAGAALRGRRFNRAGVHALYLSTAFDTAFIEVSQGRRIVPPYTLVSYQVDARDVADMRDESVRTAHRASLADMDCAWSTISDAGGTPPSWVIADHLIAAGCAGALIPSFAVGADPARHHNLVLWRWNDGSGSTVTHYDPDGRLPIDRSSWGTRP